MLAGSRALFEGWPRYLSAPKQVSVVSNSTSQSSPTSPGLFLVALHPPATESGKRRWTRKVQFATLSCVGATSNEIGESAMGPPLIIMCSFIRRQLVTHTPDGEASKVPSDGSYAGSTEMSGTRSDNASEGTVKRMPYMPLCSSRTSGSPPLGCDRPSRAPPQRALVLRAVWHGSSEFSAVRWLLSQHMLVPYAPTGSRGSP
mmetsp:Transcript_12495/g.38187  ORF Transcript_12495/g.38187 Transcript_12495/m.38187 type:complete len:202 (+) Transcript_12495:2600-3205(+)|eukprot:scaffold193803_cov32-Tisochrysis_lutea.AAC.6